MECFCGWDSKKGEGGIRKGEKVKIKLRERWG